MRRWGDSPGGVSVKGSEMMACRMTSAFPILTVDEEQMSKVLYRGRKGEVVKGGHPSGARLDWLAAIQIPERIDSQT